MSTEESKQCGNGCQKEHWEGSGMTPKWCKRCEYEPEEVVEFYEVSCAENPDVEYFNTLEKAKAFCDKHDDLDYGLIMLCDEHKKHIGDWGDYDEE
tara:strand:+ start:285 stop:572 length:288 start_codon:yes stop_codon:yes gene_type:complete